MNRKTQFEIPPKVVLLILSVLCILLMFITVFFSDSIPILNRVTGTIFVPMEKGVNNIGLWVEERVDSVKSVKKLREENANLQDKVDSLQAQMKSLKADENELQQLRELYKLDKKYESYQKVGARIIASDSSNWYSTFTIDKGSKDGIKVDMNVIAGQGLVGIVYSVGPNYAKVRSIIDDTSFVSAMFTTTVDNCIVNGDLKSIASGYITVDHINKDAKINENDELVTSNVSSKFLPGITIGYVSDIVMDSNNLTKSGKVTPVVDFKHLEDVLVILQLKETGDEEYDLNIDQTDSAADHSDQDANKDSEQETTTQTNDAEGEKSED